MKMDHFLRPLIYKDGDKISEFYDFVNGPKANIQVGTVKNAAFANDFEPGFQYEMTQFLPRHIAVKSMPYNQKAAKEMQVMYKLANDVKERVFVRGYGYTLTLDRSMVHIVMEYVPAVAWKTVADLENACFEVLATLYTARRYGFIHNDLSTSNILFQATTETREYVMKGKTWKTSHPLMPRIIDFGNSSFRPATNKNSDLVRFAEVLWQWIGEAEALGDTSALKQVRDYIRVTYPYNPAKQQYGDDTSTNFDAIRTILTRFPVFEKFQTVHKRAKVGMCLTCHTKMATVQWKGTNKVFCGVECAREAWYQ